MWIFLVLFSLSAFALESFERLKNVKIMRVLPDNIVMLNRGLEDGIIKNDHIKLTNEAEGYATRGICVKANRENSYWKLYRIPHSEAISMDYAYTIEGAADKEIPFPQATLREQNIAIQEPDPKKDAGPDPFKVTKDLPERLTERDLLDAEGYDKNKLFIERAIDHEHIKRDLSAYHVSVYASPFMKQSINEGESIRYGFKGANMGSRYRLLTQFEQQRTKLKDPVTENSVSTESKTAQAQFIIHRLTKHTSSLSLVNFQSTKFSRLGTPKSHWQFGPVGLTWHFYESKTWEYLDLSYVPLYDMRQTEILNSDNTVSVEKKNGIRHGFRFAMKTKINERVAFENLLWVRPFQDLGSFAIEGDNLNLVNDLKLIFNLSGNLFFDYNFVYQKDKLWATLSGLPEINTINSLNLRYDFDI